MLTSKHYRVFLLLGVFGFAGLMLLYYHLRTSNLVNGDKEISRYQYPRPRHNIRGFRFNGIREGKRTISIMADRFSIDKKKLGFFRFGLMNVARLENASIHIYGTGGLPRQRPRNVKRTKDLPIEKSKQLQSNVKQTSDMPGEGSERPHPDPKLHRDITFKDVFSRQALASFPIKRISSIQMEPVYVTLHDEQSVVTRISAASAAIRLKKRDILFKGNVRVASGARVLTTGQLRMLAEKAVIKTDRHFVLKTPQKQYEGEQLTTDIFLRSVKSFQEIPHPSKGNYSELRR